METRCLVVVRQIALFWRIDPALSKSVICISIRMGMTIGFPTLLKSLALESIPFCLSSNPPSQQTLGLASICVNILSRRRHPPSSLPHLFPGCLLLLLPIPRYHRRSQFFHHRLLHQSQFFPRRPRLLILLLHRPPARSQVRNRVWCLWFWDCWLLFYDSAAAVWFV